MLNRKLTNKVFINEKKAKVQYYISYEKKMLTITKDNHKLEIKKEKVLEKKMYLA